MEMTKTDKTGIEALGTAGLDWEVEKRPVFLEGGVPVPYQYATVRKDNGKPLGIVGENYRVFNNRTMASFLDRFGLGEAVQSVKAGSFDDGRRVYIQALLGTFKIQGDDDNDGMEKYLTMTTTHDGTASFTPFLTPRRISCKNSLLFAIRMARQEEGSEIQNVRHTKTMALQVGKAQENLGLILNKFKAFEDKANALCAVKMTLTGFEAYVKASGLVPNKEELSGKAKGIMEEVSNLFEYGKGQTSKNRGTAWAGLNAITEYVDHARTTRGEDKATGRLESALFGSGAIIKRQAWDNALALA